MWPHFSDKLSRASVLRPACRRMTVSPELEIVSKDGMTKKQLEIIMMVNISNKLGLFR